MRRFPLLGLCVLLLASGCDDETTPADAGPGDSGFVDLDAMVDSAMPPTGDGNDTFADADPVTIGPDPTPARIGEPGDQDYYRIEGNAGDWITIFTQTEDPGDGSEFADCVLQLFDASETMIAENDDAIPRGIIGTGTDSEIIIQLPETGVYYAMVQEWSQWSDTTPFEGGADYVYELYVQTLDPALEQVNIETEMGATPMTATHVRGSAGDFAIIAGTFADGSDVDAYVFSVMHRRNAGFQVMPMGPTGFGSSSLPGRMWITNADGSEIIARIDDPSMLDSISPPLPDLGDYQFHVEAPTTPGANPFYVVKTIRRQADNPLELDDVANDDPTGAQVMMLVADDATPTFREAFVRSDLPEGDVDWFQVDVASGEALSVICGSRTSGSGVMDLRATVFDSTGATEMGTSTEMPAMNAFIDELSVSPGDYLIRVDRGAQVADVTGAWARCRFIAAPPAP